MNKTLTIIARLLFLAACGFIIGFSIGKLCQAEPSVKRRTAVHEPKYKIAILDTGYDSVVAGSPLKLCRTGSYDYAEDKAEVGSADEKHGTYVSSLIARILSDVDYCAVVFQVYGKEGEFTTGALVDALNRSRKLGVVAVNLSYRSGFFDWEEYASLRKLAEDGTMIFAAAGNENNDLNKTCNVYPACYNIHNLITVGALTADGDAKASYSNYGTKVTRWYPGYYVNGRVTARGTSFAAPQALGWYVLHLSQGKH